MLEKHLGHRLDQKRVKSLEQMLDQLKDPPRGQTKEKHLGHKLDQQMERHLGKKREKRLGHRLAQ